MGDTTSRITQHLDSWELENMEDGEKIIFTKEKEKLNEDYVFTAKTEIQKRIIDGVVLLTFNSYVLNGSGCSWAIYKFENGEVKEVGHEYEYTSFSMDFSFAILKLIKQKVIEIKKGYFQLEYHYENVDSGEMETHATISSIEEYRKHLYVERIEKLKRILK